MSCFDAFQWQCLFVPIYLFAWLMRLMFCGAILAGGAVIFGLPALWLASEIHGAFRRRWP